MSAKKLLRVLCYKGPYDILTGDLSVIGVPGVIYTPIEGQALPVVVFTHGWLTPIDRYDQFLRHLASWGIVIAAPANYTGLAVSELSLAQDAIVTGDAITNMRLGAGDITVNKYRLGFVGHGSGASAAVLAASAQNFTDKIQAYVAVWPAPTSPLVYNTAQKITKPSLILTNPGNYDTYTSNAALLARSLGGTVLLRTIEKSSYHDFSSSSFAARIFTGRKQDRKIARYAYAAITGFLLAELALNSEYKVFTGSDNLGPIQNIDIDTLPVNKKPYLLELLK